MFSIENQAGLSVFNNKIQFVELTFSDNKYSLKNIDEEYFEDIIDFSDEENFIYVLQNSFDKLSERLSINTNYVSISLPPELFLTASVPIDTQLSRSDLSKHDSWELNLLFPNTNLKDYTFRSLRSDNKVSELIKKNIYVGIRKSILKKLHQFSIKNNLALKFIDASNIVSHVVLAKNFELRSNLISIYKSGDQISITAGNEFQLIYFRTLDLSKLENYVQEISSIFQHLTENYVFGKSDFVYFISATSDDLIKELNEKLGLKIKTAGFHNYFKDYIYFENNFFLNNSYDSFFAAASIALRQI